jgi:hypothetical protein
MISFFKSLQGIWGSGNNDYHLLIMQDIGNRMSYAADAENNKII